MERNRHPSILTRNLGTFQRLVPILFPPSSRKYQKRRSLFERRHRYSPTDHASRVTCTPPALGVKVRAQYQPWRAELIFWELRHPSPVVPQCGSETSARAASSSFAPTWW